MNTKRRSFLFLQGPSSPLFARLADKLHIDGHSVHKISFNCGDIAYWLPRQSILFRRELKDLPEFLESVWLKYGITDQILFGDCRPVHRSAITRAEAFGIRTHVFEEGYFRPHWVTLEREGVNGHSLLPRDPDWFRDVGKDLPEPAPAVAFQSPFTTRATHDVLYHVAGIGNLFVFPHYRTHALVTAPIEYAGYIRRLSLLRIWKYRDKKVIRNLLNSKARYYLLPLQLNSDSQIRDHSRFENMTEVIEYVMTSFARHAPRDSRLVIKNHPLDAGLVNYQKTIRQFEILFALEGRVIYLESGDLEPLLKQAAGTVTLNSTVGGLSLELNCPTIALSDPIYNLPGLTFQGGLDAFWLQASKPEAELYHCYRNTVMYTTQINGGLYSKKSIDLTIQNAARFLEADQSPLEQLL